MSYNINLGGGGKFFSIDNPFRQRLAGQLFVAISLESRILFIRNLSSPIIVCVSNKRHNA